ncbi:hypothetical protein GGF32_005579 [Allomyces javanicus]|nr:hypothetical protein GGF32_005579 [Allomyces javanicus]
MSLNMVHVMQAQLIEQNVSLADPLDVISLSLRWIYFSRGQAVEIDRLFAQYEIDPVDHDANDPVFLLTYFRLHALLGALKDGPAIYDPDLNSNDLTPAQQFASDVELLKIMATTDMQYVQHAGVKQFLHVNLSIDTIVAPDTYWDGLINMAQLFEACRHYGSKNGVDVSWPDLDRFMSLYDKESLFAGRVPDSAEAFLKTCGLMQGLSIGSIMAHVGQQGRMPRNTALRPSPDGKRQLKARSDTTLLFRDHFLHRTVSTKPAPQLQRSSDLVMRIHKIIEDLTTIGAVASTRLGDADINFSGRSLRPVLDKLQLTPAALPRRGKRLDATAAHSFVEEMANDETYLLRCDVFNLHLRSIDVLGHIIYDDLEARLSPAAVKDCFNNLEGVLPRIFSDWWFIEGDLGEVPPLARPRAMIHGAAEYLRTWTTALCREECPIQMATLA